MMSLRERLEAIVGPERVQRNALLAPLTTFKAGGPADWLVEVRSVPELCEVLDIARRSELPLTVLGGGSNLLVADSGVRGIVVRIRGGEVRLRDDLHVRADGGVTMNGLVRWTIAHGRAGLELWAGTPGTVGGAIYGNAHFRGRNIGDLVVRVGVVARDGVLAELDGSQMEFAYDTSRLQQTREILLWADFRVHQGQSAALREMARQSLAYRKQTQPLHLPSAGCIFQNPGPAIELPAGVAHSAGALIDRAGLKGHRIGRARVSEVHANFIVNDGGASAGDIRRLIDACKTGVRERFGVELKEEIVCLGEF